MIPNPRTGGILTAATPKPAVPQQPSKPVEKIDFEEPAAIAAKQRAEYAKNMQESAKKGLGKEEQVAKLNEALQGASGGSEGDKLEKELQEAIKYSPEDLEMAEQLLFTGRAVKNCQLTEKMAATMSTLSTLEVDIVNEMLYEFTKSKEDDKGRLDVSQRTLDLTHQFMLIAFSFKGYNDEDFISNKAFSLDIIKNAIRKLAELELSGSLESYNKLRSEIKSAVSKRVTELKVKFPATVIDILSAKRFELERLMHDVLSRGNILPKS